MVPIMKRLGLKNLVATDMDPKTGKINGEFAAGPYKVDAYVKKFKLEDMDNFYSDSYVDNDLAVHAKHAFVVYGDDQIAEWNEYFKTHKKK